jgi:hypothetical protein
MILFPSPGEPGHQSFQFEKKDAESLVQVRCRVYRDIVSRTSEFYPERMAYYLPEEDKILTPDK